MAPAARRVLRALLVGIAVSVAVTGLSRVGVLAGWETRAVDAFLFLRDPVRAPGIAVVALDEDAFRALGERQPISRRYLADLCDVLLRSGARVVGLDITLKATSAPEDDAALVAVAGRWNRAGARRLVFAAVAVPLGARAEYGLEPFFAPDLPGLTGFSNGLIGSDGVIRRMAPTLPGARGRALPAFSLAVTAALAGYTEDSLATALDNDAGSLTLPVRDRQGALDRSEPVSVRDLRGASWRIDFTGPPGTLTTFPSGPIVDLARRGVEPAADNPFRERIVLVGATFAESRDAYATPVGAMSGVEIHANMVYTLLSRRALRPPPWPLNLAVLFGACVLVALLSLWLRAGWVALISGAVVAGVAVLSYEAYTRGGYWLDFLAPVLGMVLYLEGSRLLSRRRLRDAFGQYVGPEVMARVLHHGAALGGEVRVVSVLFSDLRGFTTVAERLPPERISEMMNEYFTAMIDVILSRRGIVQDFVGDAILAVFGAPVSDPDHAGHAVAAAREMLATFERLSRGWAAAGRPALAMGIAINTGQVFAGNVGSPRKKKYAVIGDIVNTVTRMEGLNRDLSTSILISRATYEAIRGRGEVRSRGAVPVRGRAQPVEVFELLPATAGAGGAHE
jgi:class 3 adenylate cyclase